MKIKYFIVIFLVSFLILFSSAYACIRVPEANLLYDTTCTINHYCIPVKFNETLSECKIKPLGVDYRSYGTIGNKTEIVNDLEEYKNYSYACLTPNNETGDEIGYFEGRIDKSHWMFYKYLRLSDNDISVIADFLSNGYSVIKQSPEEYQNFLENANKINNDLSTCDYYSAVAYRDSWTGYIFDDESYKTEACSRAPRSEQCGSSGTTNVILNELTPISKSTTIFATFLNYWWLIVIIIMITLTGTLYKFKKK